MQVTTSWLVLSSFVLNLFALPAGAALSDVESKAHVDKLMQQIPEAERAEVRQSLASACSAPVGKDQPWNPRVYSLKGKEYMVRTLVLPNALDTPNPEFSVEIQCTIFGQGPRELAVSASTTSTDCGPEGCRDASPAETIQKQKAAVDAIAAKVNEQATAPAAASGCSPEAISKARAGNNSVVSCLFGAGGTNCMSSIPACAGNFGVGIMDNLFSNFYGLKDIASWIGGKLWNGAKSAKNAAVAFLFGGDSAAGAQAVEDKASLSAMAAANTTDQLKEKVLAAPNPEQAKSTFFASVMGAGPAFFGGIATMITDSLRTAYLCDEWMTPDGKKTSRWDQGVQCKKYSENAQCLGLADIMATSAGCGLVGFVAGEVAFAAITGGMVRMSATAIKGVTKTTDIGAVVRRGLAKVTPARKAAPAAARAVDDAAQAAAKTEKVGDLTISTQSTRMSQADLAAMKPVPGRAAQIGKKMIIMPWNATKSVGSGLATVGRGVGTIVSTITSPITKPLGAYMRLTDDAYFMGYYGTTNRAAIQQIRAAKSIQKGAAVTQKVITEDGRAEVILRSAADDAFRVGDVSPISGSKIDRIEKVEYGNDAWKAAYFDGALEGAQGATAGRAANSSIWKRLKDEKVPFWRNNDAGRVDRVVFDDGEVSFVARSSESSPTRVGAKFEGKTVMQVDPQDAIESARIAQQEGFQKATEAGTFLVGGRSGSIQRQDFMPTFFHRRPGGSADVLASGAAPAVAAAGAANEAAAVARTVAQDADDAAEAALKVDSAYFKQMEGDFDEIAKAETKMNAVEYDPVAWALAEKHVQNLGACKTDECFEFAKKYLASSGKPAAGMTAVARAMAQWDPAKLPWDEMGKVLAEPLAAAGPARSAQTRVRRALSELVADNAAKNEKAYELAREGYKRSVVVDKLGRFRNLADDEGVVSDYYRGLLQNMSRKEVKQYADNVLPRIARKAQEEFELNKWVDGKLIANRIDPVDHGAIDDLIREMGDRGWTKPQIQKRVDQALASCGGKP
jgi:hypothetical protein